MKTKFLITSLILSLVSYSGIKGQTCNASGTVTTTSTPGLVNINDMSTTSSGAIWTSSQVRFSNGGFVSLQPATTAGTYQFTADGYYHYYVEVMDSLTNCYDSIQGTIGIFGTTTAQSCDASFTSSVDSNDCLELNYQITNNTNTHNEWDFGDGTIISNNSSGSHVYANPGTYQVKLTSSVLSVTNAWSCQDSTIQTVTVGCVTPPCNASFALQPDSSNVGQYYAWNTSTGGNLSYYWDFDDGSSSTLAYPTHTYTATGTYVICLTVTSPSCTSTYCDTLVATVKASGTTLNVLAPGQVVGIENLEFLSNLNTYPNPFGSFVNVSVSSTQFQELQLSVISIDGSQVYSENVSVEAGENLIELNELQVSSGIYMLNVTNPLTGQSKMHKMIKK